MNKPALGRSLGELMDRQKGSAPSATPPAGSTAPAPAKNNPAPGTGVKILLRGHLRPPVTASSPATATATPQKTAAKLSLETRLTLFAADILLCFLSTWIVLSAKTPLTWYAWLLVVSAVTCGAVLGCLAFEPEEDLDKK